MIPGWRTVVIDGVVYHYWAEGQRRHRLVRERPTSSRVIVDTDRLFLPSRRAEAPPPYDDVGELLEEDDAGDRGVFGLEPDFTRAELRDAHRALVWRHHPDRGGNLHVMQMINAAFSRLFDQVGRRRAS